MPELPEVQNTINGMRDYIVGERIADVWTDYDSSFYYGKENIKDPDYFDFFKAQLLGSRVDGVERAGKHIYIHFDTGYSMATHMKMTGHFLLGRWQWHSEHKKWQPPQGFWNPSWQLEREEVSRTMPFSDPYNDFIHLMITFESGLQLAFSDMRKFATVTLLDACKLAHEKSKLGIDMLDEKMTPALFATTLQTKPKKKIKSALLDQSLTTGFGNIYSDEALFRAGIHPERLVKDVSQQAFEKLFHVSLEIFATAIASGGDSMGDYRRTDGSRGSFQGLHRVYQKENTPCPHCGSLIEKKLIDQRIGRFCPRCQKL